MRRGFFSARVFPKFKTKTGIIVIFIIILIIAAACLFYYEQATQQVTITPLSNEGEWVENPEGILSLNGFEFRIYANITGLPKNTSDYYCIASYYDRDTGEIFDQTNTSLANYSADDPNKTPCSVLKWGWYRNIGHVEIAIHNKTGALLAYSDYEWNNSTKLLKNIPEYMYDYDGSLKF